jgi:hypothetical protein
MQKLVGGGGEATKQLGDSHNPALIFFKIRASCMRVMTSVRGVYLWMEHEYASDD